MLRGVRTPCAFAPFFVRVLSQYGLLLGISWFAGHAFRFSHDMVAVIDKTQDGYGLVESSEEEEEEGDEEEEEEEEEGSESEQDDIDEGASYHVVLRLCRAVLLA